MNGAAGGDGEAARDALRDFRRAVYRGLRGWADALFELSDAMLDATAPVGSVPSLSLEPVFRRSHGSLYKALDRGRIDAGRVRAALAAARPADWPAVFAVDASTWPRCDAETSPERGFYYHPSRHSAGQPIVAGWSYQWIAGLSWAPDSWTAPLDVTRINPAADNTVDATLAQVRGVTERLPSDGPVPLFVFDAGYDPIALGAGLADTRAAILVRIRADRLFYADPVRPSPPAVGRPKRHGARFACADPTSWPVPDAATACDDPRYGRVTAEAWSGLHPKLQNRGRWVGTHAPIVRGTVIRVVVEHLPRPTARTLKTLWLWWSGPGTPDLDVCWRAYVRRFDLEHTFRFAKHTLGWTTPALRMPEQADRWTWLVVAAYTELRLARRLVDDQRLPWERPTSPAQLTPARVRRGFRRLRASLGTPASPPKSSKPGPGRPKGTRRPPRTRYPAVKKTAPRV
jgi:DDE superfamily endonuclease